MSHPPKIAFCTTCKGRLQHLEHTLPANVRDNAGYPNCIFVVLDYNSQDGLADFMSRTLRNDLLSRSGGQTERIVFYRYLEPTPFRMAHAKNVAHRLGILEGADILVNLDADNLTGFGFADYIAEQFQADPNCFLMARRNAPPLGGDMLPKGINGRIAVSRHAFLNAGGYDEQRFETWGPDDKDFHHRLQRMGYTPQQVRREFLKALLHNDRMRFKDYPQAQHASEDEEPIHASDRTVANFGKLGQGTVFRNFSFRNPIHLEPVPTRIFGIGMHKTATTSLHKALQILGYDSAHWTSAHWAKAIWEEMHPRWGAVPDTGQPQDVLNPRSYTLERHYALSDLPITILYRELDAAYPGSKFILTVRDEGAWLLSVQRHWTREYNPFRAQWDDDPFTHKLHTLVYGRKQFDAGVMLARYRQHNAEVSAYFKDRPEDLLVMDMTESALRSDAVEPRCYRGAWPKLCDFLKHQTTPEVPYPNEFVTKC